MKKLGIGLQVFMCAVLSFLGFVNYGVWIWMAGKMGLKKMKLAGMVLCGLMVMLMVLAGVYDAESADILMSICMILLFLPTFVILANVGKLKRCLDLRLLVKKNNINVQKLGEQECLFIEIPENERLLKTSKMLFGDKGEAVLRVIAFNEKEKADKALAEKEDRIRQKKLQAEAEIAKAEAQKAEAEKAKAEARKAEAEKVRAEAERARAERASLEAQKAEAARAKAEAQRAEAARAAAEAKKAETEKVKAEAEKAKAEAERAIAEAERIRAEAEKAKAENQKKEIEKDRKEVRRVKTEDNREKEIKPVSIGKISEQPVDINFCDEQELSLVPGIGIILAKKAIRIRNEKGNFESVDDFVKCIRFLYKGIIIKHNKTEPTYTKTSLFLCEKRRFFMGRTEKGGKVF